MVAEASDGRQAPLTTLTCDHLVLSAGTLGTTNLLLRNRSALPRLSRKLGTHFCGNGDVLTPDHGVIAIGSDRMMAAVTAAQS